MALKSIIGFMKTGQVGPWGSLFQNRIRPPHYMERQDSPQVKYMAAPEGNLREIGRLLCLFPGPVSCQGGVQLAIKNL